VSNETHNTSGIFEQIIPYVQVCLKRYDDIRRQIYNMNKRTKLDDGWSIYNLEHLTEEHEKRKQAPKAS